MPDGRPSSTIDDPASIAVADQPTAGTQLREDRQRSRTRERIRQGLGGRAPLDSALLRGGTGAPSAVAEAEDTGAEADAAASAGYFAAGATAGRLQEARQRSRRKHKSGTEEFVGDFKKRFADATQEIQEQMLRELAEAEEELGEEGHRLMRWALRTGVTWAARRGARWAVQKLGLWAAITEAVSTLILIPLALFVVNVWLWVSVQDKFYRIPFWMKMYWYEKIAVILIDIICVILILIQLVFIIIIVWAIVNPLDAFRLLLGSGLMPLWDLVKLGLGAIF